MKHPSIWKGRAVSVPLGVPPFLFRNSFSFPASLYAVRESFESANVGHRSDKQGRALSAKKSPPLRVVFKPSVLVGTLRNVILGTSIIAASKGNHTARHTDTPE